MAKRSVNVLRYGEDECGMACPTFNRDECPFSGEFPAVLSGMGGMSILSYIKKIRKSE
jgi:hypothetical protein